VHYNNLLGRFTIVERRHTGLAPLRLRHQQIASLFVSRAKALITNESRRAIDYK